MKKHSIFLFTILIFTTFVSCEKKEDEVEPVYKISFNINGVEKVTAHRVTCTLRPNETVPSKTDFILSSYPSDGKDFLSIYVQVVGNLGVGAYSSENYPNAYVNCDYMENNGLDNHKDFFTHNVQGRPASKIVVTLLSITATEIKGSFVGNYLTNPFTNETIEFSGGEFTAKRMK